MPVAGPAPIARWWRGNRGNSVKVRTVCRRAVAAPKKGFQSSRTASDRSWNVVNEPWSRGRRRRQPNLVRFRSQCPHLAHAPTSRTSRRGSPATGVLCNSVLQLLTGGAGRRSFSSFGSGDASPPSTSAQVHVEPASHSSPTGHERKATHHRNGDGRSRRHDPRPLEATRARHEATSARDSGSTTSSAAPERDTDGPVTPTG